MWQIYIKIQESILKYVECCVSITVCVWKEDGSKADVSS